MVLPLHPGGALLRPWLSGWAEAACAAAPRVPFLCKLCLSGRLGNFSGLRSCNLESVTCVTSRGRGLCVVRAIWGLLRSLVVSFPRDFSC